MERKLAAILSADAVGYSRLMADDEAETVETIKAHKDLMGGLIRQHAGRVVDAVGDDLLADFQSVVNAVACAAAIQNELETSEPRRYRRQHDVFTDELKEKFLVALAEEGLIRTACATSHISRETIRIHQNKDPIFAEAILKAKAKAKAKADYLRPYRVAAQSCRLRKWMTPASLTTKPATMSPESCSRARHIA